MNRYAGWTPEATTTFLQQRGVPMPLDISRHEQGARHRGGRYVQQGTAGKRPLLGGQFFRSRWEACTAAYLQWQNIPYAYEPKRFIFPRPYTRNGSILIDFHLTESDEWWEVKGYMSADDQIKIKRLRRFYPVIRLEIIGKPFFREICRQRTCRLIPGYECRHLGYGS